MAPREKGGREGGRGEHCILGKSRFRTAAFVEKQTGREGGREGGKEDVP